jgi:hypothetical protein
MSSSTKYFEKKKKNLADLPAGEIISAQLKKCKRTIFQVLLGEKSENQGQNFEKKKKKKKHKKKK